MVNPDIAPEVARFATTAFEILGTPTPELRHTKPRNVTGIVVSRLNESIDKPLFFRELLGKNGLDYPNSERIAQGLANLETVPWFSGPQPVNKSRVEGVAQRLYQYANNPELPVEFVDEERGFLLARNFRSENYLPIANAEYQVKGTRAIQVDIVDGLARAIAYDSVFQKAGSNVLYSEAGKDAQESAGYLARNLYLHPEFPTDPSIDDDFYNFQGLNHLEYNPGNELMEIWKMGYWPLGEVRTSLDGKTESLAFAICTFPFDKTADKEKLQVLRLGMRGWREYIESGRTKSKLIRKSTRVLETPTVRFSLN